MKRAFTLIELLVVVAVIALLAALLFPVFARARERARSAQCVSNLRQIGTAVQAYREDFDGRYPYAYRNEYVAWYGKASVCDVLADYLAATSPVWHCPSDFGETYPMDAGVVHFAGPSFTLSKTSYTYPGLLWPDASLTDARHPIKQPVFGVLLFESRPWHGDYDRFSKDFRYDNALYNVLHCDGHVEKETWQQRHQSELASLK